MSHSEWGKYRAFQKKTTRLYTSINLSVEKSFQMNRYPINVVYWKGSSSSVWVCDARNTHLRYAFMSDYDLKSTVTSSHFQPSFTEERTRSLNRQHSFKHHKCIFTPNPDSCKVLFYQQIVRIVKKKLLQLNIHH